MSYGIPFVAQLPTPGVTPSPSYEAMLDAFLREAKAKLEQKITDTDTSIVGADVKHGVRITEYGAGLGLLATGAPVYNVAGDYWNGAGATDQIAVPIPVETGQTLLTVSFSGRANGATAWKGEVYKIDKTTGTVSLLASATSGTAAAIELLSVSINAVAAFGVAYRLLISLQAAGNRYLGFQTQRLRT